MGGGVEWRVSVYIGCSIEWSVCILGGWGGGGGEMVLSRLYAWGLVLSAVCVYMGNGIEQTVCIHRGLVLSGMCVYLGLGGEGC